MWADSMPVLAPLYHHVLTWCIVCNRRPVNICWMNQRWIDEQMNIESELLFTVPGLLYISLPLSQKKGLSFIQSLYFLEKSGDSIQTQVAWCPGQKHLAVKFRNRSILAPSSQPDTKRPGHVPHDARLPRVGLRNGLWVGGLWVVILPPTSCILNCSQLGCMSEL